jgi:hypothetical protein
MDSGVYRPGALQPWQREHILAAASFLRERFGNPPTDPRARVAHDSLLEVLDPVRRTVRMQKETSVGSNPGTASGRQQRSETDRRQQNDRRKANQGPPPETGERRKAERRKSADRRARS